MAKPSGVAAVSASAPTAPDAEAGRARRKAYEDTHAGDGVAEEVLLLLDMMGDRLQRRGGGVEQAQQTLCTVLRNAAAGGEAGADPKYRTLRAANDKLWARVLCHQEMRAVLGAAGFEWHWLPRTQHQGAAADEVPAGGACTCIGTSDGDACGLPRVDRPPVLSFINSSFPTRVEYEAWLRDRSGAVPPAATLAGGSGGAAAALDERGTVEAQAQAEAQAEVEAEAVAEAEAEAEAVHVALAEQLDGTVPPAPGVIESLLSRLRELSMARVDADEALPGGVQAGGGADDERDDEEVQRAFELVHPGHACAESMAELEAVLAAVNAWCFDPHL